MAELPQPFLKEILHQYRDILRLGSLQVNGHIVSWSTRLVPEQQLTTFCSGLFHALREQPELDGLADDDLTLGAYWLCKALSINYVLSEVLNLLHDRAGVPCTIEDNATGARAVQYCVETLQGPELRASITWSGKGNIMCCDPRTAEKKVKGTISKVVTQFSFPPERGFAPKYVVDYELKQAVAALPFAFGAPCHSGFDDEDDVVVETVLPFSPLWRQVASRSNHRPPSFSDTFFNVSTISSL